VLANGLLSNAHLQAKIALARYISGQEETLFVGHVGRLSGNPAYRKMSFSEDRTILEKIKAPANQETPRRPERSKNVSRLPNHLISLNSILKDLTGKYKSLRTTENPEIKIKLKAEIATCYAEIKRIIVMAKQEQESFLAVGPLGIAEQNLSESQVDRQILELTEKLKMAKAFESLANLPEILKNIRRRISS